YAKRLHGGRRGDDHAERDASGWGSGDNLRDHAGGERRGAEQLLGELRQRYVHDRKRESDGDRRRQDEDLRGGQPGADSELRGLRQRRYVGEPGRHAERDDGGDRGEPGRDLSDHGQRADVGQLHNRLRGRDADGDQGEPDGDGRRQDEDLRGGEPGVDGELRGVRQRGHAGEPGRHAERDDDGDG